MIKVLSVRTKIAIEIGISPDLWIPDAHQPPEIGTETSDFLVELIQKIVIID